MKNDKVEREVDKLIFHKENRSRRGIGMRRKTAVGIFAVLIAGALIASAGILTYYGQVQMTVDVGQSVQVKAGGTGTWNDYDSPVSFSSDIPIAPGGESFCFKLWVRNRASVPAPILFNTIPGAGCGGVDANVFAFPESPITLELTSKDSAWVPTSMKATLTFNPVSPAFNYDLTASGLAEMKNML